MTALEKFRADLAKSKAGAVERFQRDWGVPLTRENVARIGRTASEAVADLAWQEDAAR